MSTEAMPRLDRRALQILFDTYWSATGWRSREARCISDEDFAYAKRAGVMFEESCFSHADIVERALAAVSVVDRRTVADAFVISLSSRRLELRSALGSFAVLQHFARHEIPKHDDTCPICGANSRTETLEDLNVLNFERFKWGGVRHDKPLYAAMDLELFARLRLPAPASEDVRLLRSMLHAVDAAPASTSSAALEKHVAKVINSNKAERDVLIGIFGLCGILATADHPGYLSRFVPASARKLPPRRYVDMAYPACWWKRQDGVSSEAVRFWFGHLF